ncbi:hypothetical protein [Hymenobacter arizonensis]|uniref:Uncharacterized protein n=1 Tax=Hymenobacter arizonensis TaxID=1227077 RepID=A0A1I6BMU2_HYMAR|nr:hypothetical protein [Hymenobacter arizonensis]SFQ82231.1 hypothetical protein SAMN04515668_4766 [Hymenobacter arizonensis]
MPYSVFYRRTTPAALLVCAAVLGSAAYAQGLRPPPAAPDVSQPPAGGILVGLAGLAPYLLYLLVHLLVFLGFLLFGLVLALVLLSPVMLLAIQLLRYRRRKRAERDAGLHKVRRRPPFPTPVALPLEEPLPLLQRRFRH